MLKFALKVFLSLREWLEYRKWVPLARNRLQSWSVSAVAKHLRRDAEFFRRQADFRGALPILQLYSSLFPLGFDFLGRFIWVTQVSDF
jgi:hypothetical protein